MIAVIDYGIGNIGSILNMLRKIGVPCEATSNPDAIAQAEKIVLPGVGSFDAGMQALTDTNMAPAIRHAVRCRVPLLGVCLGMQLMMESSAEGKLPGLGLVPGRCEKFVRHDRKLRVPHMGWNITTPVAGAALFDPKESELRYYFVHTYHVVCDDRSHVAATTEYGVTFTSALQHRNVYGVQFHPEKSHRFGMDMFRRFAKV
jgi:imidazole glycerol-phosphate synthase subunit HisH